MRIGLVTGSFLPNVGGLEWKVHYLAHEYTRRGHDATVFSPHPIRSLRGLPLQVRPGYTIVRAGSIGRGQGALGIIDFSMGRALRRAHRSAPFDVVHCHHIGRPASWGLRLKREFGVPVVGTTCGDDVFAVPELNYGARLRPKYDRMIRRNVRMMDVVGAISRGIRAELEAIGTTARIVDIPNGAAFDEFQLPPGRMLHERLGIPDDDLIVLSVGRNLNCKRYDLGLLAFSRVAEKIQNVHYVLVGRELERLQPRIDALCVGPRVHLISELHIAEVAQALHSADVFFNPSMREGFAQVNAQALASGLPLVVTDAPGNHDAADYGGALVARSEDAESMAGQLVRILGDAGLRRRLGIEARAAGEHYAWSRIAEQYLDVFGELVERGRPGKVDRIKLNG